MATKTGKEWGIDVTMAIIAGFLALLLTRCLSGCNEPIASGDKKAINYAVTLEECNRQANDLCASIACENQARATNGRFAREVPKHCIAKDGGAGNGLDGSSSPDNRAKHE